MRPCRSVPWRAAVRVRALLQLALLVHIARYALRHAALRRQLWRSAMLLHVALLLSALAPPGAAGSSSSLCSRSHTLLLGTARAKLSVHPAQWTGLGLVQIANLVLPTSQMISAFELKRALLYSRLVFDQRGRQFESSSSYKIVFFFCTVVCWITQTLTLLL